MLFEVLLLGRRESRRKGSWGKELLWSAGILYRDSVGFLKNRVLGSKLRDDLLGSGK